MTHVRFGRRALRAASGLAIAAMLIAAPAGAQAGFFEQLFGGGAPSPAPAPTYQAPPAADPLSPDLDVPQRIHRPKKHVVREDKPVRQMPTDIWHDKTLQFGDAVMMKDGVHIYLGSESSKHFAKDFVPIDGVANVPKKQYAELTALDTARNDPLKDGKQPDTLASGRSSAVSTPISKGFRITDARGKSLRYVGP